ncbi:ArsR/SmtB family transcription factor [Paractinoplanes ferrugineus]|uniref:ArsR/SmtB family transcription factor n=1 Tax=Paractinoplanes ferrugineus TaxID=113564 RepID=UPI001944D36F|nr:winged helix-turn-helix domain-containing protein [Actinoplanes ferrugineus]
MALSHLRISLSPLWETFGSLSSLAWGRASSWPHSEWGRNAEQALAGRPGAALVTWIRRLHGQVPQELTPVPSTIERSIDMELQAMVGRLAEAGSDRLADLIAGSPMPPGTSGSAWLTWLTEAVLDYWEAALEPYWASMRMALRNDVSQRAQRLATEGTDAVLAAVDSRLRWQRPVLTLSTAAVSATVECDERLILVPMLFGRRATRCVVEPAGVVGVSYQARGAALLAKPRTARAPSDDDRLALLLGRGRAAVLRGLAEPTTTSDLAESLGLSASTISEHLKTLVAADVVHKRRDGVRVIYALDGAGMALLKYLGDEDAPPPH